VFTPPWHHSLAPELPEVMSTEAVRTLGLRAAINHARPSPLRPVLPVVEELRPPLEVLLPLVRLGQVLVHEGDDDFDQLPLRLHNVTSSS